MVNVSACDNYMVTFLSHNYVFLPFLNLSLRVEFRFKNLSAENQIPFEKQKLNRPRKRHRDGEYKLKHAIIYHLAFKLRIDSSF